MTDSPNHTPLDVEGLLNEARVISGDAGNGLTGSERNALADLTEAGLRLLDDRRELVEALRGVTVAFTLAHAAHGIDPAGSISLSVARAALAKVEA